MEKDSIHGELLKGSVSAPNPWWLGIGIRLYRVPLSVVQLFPVYERVPGRRLHLLPAGHQQSVRVQGQGAVAPKLGRENHVGDLCQVAEVVFFYLFLKILDVQKPGSKVEKFPTSVGNSFAGLTNLKKKPEDKYLLKM